MEPDCTIPIPPWVEPGDLIVATVDTRPMGLRAQVAAFERRVIQAALTATGGNRAQAAKLLGISLRSLFYKLRHLDLAEPR